MGLPRSRPRWRSKSDEKSSDCVYQQSESGEERSNLREIKSVMHMSLHSAKILLWAHCEWAKNMSAAEALMVNSVQILSPVIHRGHTFR